MSARAFAWSDASVRRALALPGPGDASRRYRRVSTDTRTLGAGDVFVALEGPRFDGHDFLSAAVAAGCGAIVGASAKIGVPGVPAYGVSDTLAALGDLALHRRLEAGVPVVGITGSSGKTTVKNLLLGALGPGAHGTEGNLNNRIGVPLTILATPVDASSLVVEMGTNEPGEIAELARVARPTAGVVTTASETHVERLDGLEGVIAEKLELLAALDDSGAAFVGDEPPELVRAARRIRPDAKVVGWSDRADARRRPTAARPGPDGAYAFVWRGRSVSLRIPGRHAVHNALLALEVARALGVEELVAAAGASRVGPAPLRGEVRRAGGRRLLIDCYNANAAGVAAGLATLADMRVEGERVAVLGTMLELGARSAAIHRAALEAALETNVDRLVLLGAFAEQASRYSDDRIEVASDVAELGERVAELTAPGDAVLLKASRGARLERAIPAFEALGPLGSR